MHSIADLTAQIENTFVLTREALAICKDAKAQYLCCKIQRDILSTGLTLRRSPIKEKYRLIFQALVH